MMPLPDQTVIQTRKFNTWLQWIGQRQLQDETIIIEVSRLGTPHIRGLTVGNFCCAGVHIPSLLTQHVHVHHTLEWNFSIFFMQLRCQKAILHTIRAAWAATCSGISQKLAYNQHSTGTRFYPIRESRIHMQAKVLIFRLSKKNTVTTGHYVPQKITTTVTKHNRAWNVNDVLAYIIEPNALYAVSVTVKYSR